MASNQPDTASLQVIVDEEVVFQSYGKWLYPIFDLEEYLHHTPLKIGEAIVHDKVIGKAAALLLIRLNPAFIHGEVMSDLAINSLTQFNRQFSYNQRVARIDCQTEEILLAVDDPEIAYEILCKRANRC